MEIEWKIQNCKQAVDVLGINFINNFNKMQDLHYYFAHEGGARISAMEMVLDSGKDEGKYRIKLRFEHISNLKISNFGGNEVLFEGFDLIDISNDQWEDVNFQVMDYEDDTINFYCKSVTMLSFSAIE